MPPTRKPTRPAAPADGTASVDGRRAWRDRNLNAVVDALLDLFAEGNLRPGADEIAARSGVSRRSVFRYFDDLDTLDRMAIDRQVVRVAHLVDLERIGEGSLDARIERIVGQRIRLFEAIAPIARVSRLRAPFEPVVAEELSRSRRLFRRQVERHFDPELRTTERAQRTSMLAAATVVCSFESYDLLRYGHGMTDRQISDTMRTGLSAIFSP